MRIILFDLLFAQPHDDVKFHGGGEYTKTIFLKLVEIITDKRMLHVVADRSKYLDEKIVNVIEDNNITLHNVNNEDDIIHVIRNMSKEQSLLFFAGMIYPYRKSVFGDNVFAVGVCHGLRMMEIPKDRYSLLYAKSFKSFSREFIRMLIPTKVLYGHSKKKYVDALSKFDLIYTVSKHSLYSIKTHCFSDDLNINIKVHYQTLKYNSYESRASLSEVRYEYKANKYILMISADRWEKNSYRGIKALDALISEGKMSGYQVVVLGNYPRILRKLVENRERFLFKGYVEADELEYAYQNCKIFFYPSLNEGYGLPPMEAMKYKKTCVLSSVCSLPEVYGEAVYYCNPYDIGEMKVRIMEALNEEIPASAIDFRMRQLAGIQSESTKELLRVLMGEAQLD